MSVVTRVLVVVPLSLLAYSVFALTHRRWISGLAAPVVAWFLLTRHPRARFAVYVFLSIVLARSVVRYDWWLVAGALAVLSVLQLPAATRQWPRVRRGFRSTGFRSDRMARR